MNLNGLGDNKPVVTTKYQSIRMTCISHSHNPISHPQSPSSYPRLASNAPLAPPAHPRHASFPGRLSDRSAPPAPGSARPPLCAQSAHPDPAAGRQASSSNPRPPAAHKSLLPLRQASPVDLAIGACVAAARDGLPCWSRCRRRCGSGSAADRLSGDEYGGRSSAAGYGPASVRQLRAARPRGSSAACALLGCAGAGMWLLALVVALAFGGRCCGPGEW